MTAHSWAVARELTDHVNSSLSLPLDEARTRFERKVLAGYLAQTGGNITHAARHAGIERVSFIRAMRRTGLTVADAMGGGSA
jgi:DNA-binding NtrC family response regulator